MKSQARTDASLIERLAGHWLKSDPGDRASRHLLRRQVMLIDRLARIALIVLGGIICSSACAAEPTPWPAQYLIDPWDTAALTPADVVGPDGLVYPDFRRAGVEGGIPDITDGTRFDVTGFDGADDDARVAAALAAAQEAGGGVVFFPDGRYLLRREHLVETDGVVFLGESREGTVITVDGDDKKNRVFSFQGGEPGDYIAITGDVPRGSMRITVDATTGFEAGDWVNIRAQEVGETMSERYNRPQVGLVFKEPWHFGRFYFSKIATVDTEAGVLVLDRPVHHDFYADERPHVRLWRPLKRCGVQRMTITASSETAPTPIMLERAANCWITDVTVDRPANHPYEIKATCHFEVRDCAFNGSRAPINHGGSSYLMIPGAYNLIDGCSARDMRHMAIYQATYASVIRDCVFSGETVQSPQLHGGHPHDNLLETTDFTCSSSRAYAVDANRSLRHQTEGPRMVLYNNRHTGGYGNAFLSYVEGHILAYNTFANADDKYQFPAVWATDHAFHCVVRGNSFEIDPAYPLLDLQDRTSAGWQVYDNHIYGSSGYVWEGDGSVSRADGNRLLAGEQRPASAPEVDSIFAWQREHADDRRLLLLIGPATVAETDGVCPARLVRIVPGGDASTGDLAVALAADMPDKLEAPAQVTIPDGSNYVDFDLQVRDDDQRDGEQTVTVAARAEGWLSDTDRVGVLDDESPPVRFAAPRPDRFTDGPREGWANGDFGRTYRAGTSTYDADNDRFTLTGAGQAITLTRGLGDMGRQFCYVAVAGDGSITARLTGIDGIDGKRSVGLMITDDESSLADSYLVTGGGGVYQWGGDYRYTHVKELRTPSATKSGVWLRLEREGSIFRAYASDAQERPPQADDWTLLNEFDFHHTIEGPYKVIGNIDELMYFGMFVNADGHYITAGGEHRTATATFDQVTVTGNADE